MFGQGAWKVAFDGSRSHRSLVVRSQIRPMEPLSNAERTISHSVQIMESRVVVSEPILRHGTCFVLFTASGFVGACDLAQVKRGWDHRRTSAT